MGESTRLLIYLADKGALYKEIELSTIKIAKERASTQQTISRKLVDMEKNGLIGRIASTRGIKIRLRDKGVEEVKRLYITLKNIFGEKIQSFKGRVESGVGEGAYYVSLKPYLEQFRKKLGFVPYKGTLNVRVDYANFLQFITTQQKIKIDGFKASNRTFGPIVAYKTKLNRVEAAIVIPKRTSHERDVIEIISAEYLRGKFHLKDGDELEIN